MATRQYPQQDGRVLPTVRPGDLRRLAACPARFRLALVGGRARLPLSAANRRRRFLLAEGVVDAVRAGHRAAAERGRAVADALDPRPPPALTAEEAAVHERAVETYALLAAGRRGAWRSTPVGFVRLASRSGRFRLSVRVDVSLDLPDGGMEVRRLRLGPVPGALGDDPEVAATAVVLRHRPYLRFARVDLLGGVVEHVDVSHDRLASLGGALRDRVTAVLEDPDASAVAGRACATCPWLRGCPAVPQAPADDVVGPEPGGAPR